MSTPGKSRSLVCLWLAAIVAGGVLACRREASELLPLPPGSAYRPECPVDQVTYLTDTVEIRTQSVEALSLSQDRTLVPEYHDCQRFPPGSGGTYGALIGIFARKDLNQHITRMYQLAQQGQAVRAVAIGQILAFDGRYRHLGIRFGFNCLYLWSPTGTAGELEAFMLGVDTNESACMQDRDTTERHGSRAKELKVFRRTVEGYGQADYPEVARWDWDGRGHKQYIVIGCLDSWCDIAGDASLSKSPDLDHPGKSPAYRRALRIKPWYDAQRLMELGATGKGFASKVGGTFWPDELLGTYTTVDDYRAQWKTVGYTFLSRASSLYKRKLNFDPGSVTNPNVVALCYGPQQDCVPAGEPVRNCGNTADPWWARVTPAGGGAAKYYCVIRRTHPGIPIPAMVRWRWSEDDERGWISCPGGCCEVVGDE